MKILVACEESQAVTIEFRKLGHESYSCDILPCSGGYPEWHLQQDVTELLKENWDMIISFPPCTDLCVSGAKHFARKRLDGTQQRSIEFFKLFTNVSCERVAIENPIGIMSNEYRKPTQIIQPYQFGDPVKKTTCLWLKGLPKLLTTNNVENDIKYYTSPQGKKMSEFNALQIVVDGKKCGYHTQEYKRHRSKTFPGIARAMATQWSNLKYHQTELF